MGDILAVGNIVTLFQYQCVLNTTVVFHWWNFSNSKAFNFVADGRAPYTFNNRE